MKQKQNTNMKDPVTGLTVWRGPRGGLFTETPSTGRRRRLTGKPVPSLRKLPANVQRLISTKLNNKSAARFSLVSRFTNLPNRTARVEALANFYARVVREFRKVATVLSQTKSLTQRSIPGTTFLLRQNWNRHPLRGPGEVAYARYTFEGNAYYAYVTYHIDANRDIIGSFMLRFLKKVREQYSTLWYIEDGRGGIMAFANDPREVGAARLMFRKMRISYGHGNNTYRLH